MRKSEKKRENERKREKREKKRKKREKDVQGQLSSICIQFSKIKTMYIGRNARNLKNWLFVIIAHYHYKSSCRS